MGQGMLAHHHGPFEADLLPFTRGNEELTTLEGMPPVLSIV